jgi:pimeloyl-ACP methyl ester carboxylesterase
MKPTIVLVHGAFAESSSWDGVIDPLLDAGHPVIAAANPLLEIPGASHAITVSHPEAVANQILEAAAVPATA